MRLAPRAGGAWLLAPATDDRPPGHAVAATFLRVLLGLMWLYNVAWKRPPDFGQQTDSGLYHFTAYAVSHPVLSPYSWVVETVVLPNIEIFGWAVLLVETALAVLLLTGAWVRVAALVGGAQSLAIALSVAFAPNEWPWSYWLMIGAHVLVLCSASGRWFAVDAVRAGPGRWRLLGRVWGWLAVAIGLFSLVLSFDDPLAASGPGLRSSELSLSLGTYNLVGGLVLLVVGALLVLADRTGRPVYGLAAAALGVVAALSLHAQLGFTDPVLGGNATSAGVFFSVALVASLAGTAREDPATATPGAPDRGSAT